MIKKIIALSFILLIFSTCKEEKIDTLFSKIPSKKTGIVFKNILKETEEFNVLEYGYLYNGGGVAIGDINNDSLPDIYFTGNMVGSHLYLNQGNFKFKEIAKDAGVFAEGLWNTGVTMADVNADGLLDIYVCRSAAKSANKRKNLLFINNGDLTFTEKAKEFGIADAGYTTQATFFDYDNDGDLDLYVLNHSVQEYAGFSNITASLKRKKNDAFADKLYRNDNGKFTNVSQEAGLISNVLGFGLGVAVSDINNDGWLDIYVSNDYNEQDYLYINNQDGTYTESLEKFIGHTSLFSMGCDISDINNDGFTDIFTLDMLPEDNYRQKMVSGPDNYDKYQLLINSGFYNQSMRNMLHLNNKGTSFSEIGQYANVSNTDWSWSSLFADLDNDGYKDLYITNGYKRDYTNMDFINYAVQEKIKEDKTGKKTVITELLKKMPATLVENYVYKNTGNLSFEKSNTAWGMNQKSLSNGAAYADLDNDGDLDIVVNNIDDTPFVYRNNTETLNKNNYLKVNLSGNNKNTHAIGAKVTLKFSDGKEIMQELMPTRGFQSSVGYSLNFGLGSYAKVDTLKISWPNNEYQVLTDVKANTIVGVNQNNAKKVLENEKIAVKPIFKELNQNDILNHKHDENKFVDFKQQQLLLHKLSTQGPKIASADINKDGRIDVFLGGAKGQSSSIYIQNADESFSKKEIVIFDEDNQYEDVGALFFDADNDGDQDLYVVSGGNDFAENDSALQDRLYFNNGKGDFTKKENALPAMLTSGSTVKAGDIDNDGDLDLFIGGRLTPSNYTILPRSYVLQNDGKGNFKDITKEINSELSSIGMITDAIWTDFNNDKALDLIVVGEWIGVRIFKNVNGKLVEEDSTKALKNATGWWNTIVSGDFDNDGDEDYVLGNFGHNSQLKASKNEPIELIAKDFDNNGSVDPIITSYVMGESYPIFSKDDLLSQLNNLKSKYVSYSSYADQKITDIFSDAQLTDTKKLQVQNLSSVYLKNNGANGFELINLPNEAQFAPIYAIQVSDFNNDGNLDLILGGNFYGTRVKHGRYDANKGLLLLGNGDGSFKTIDNLNSGLNIDGEVRDFELINTVKNKAILLVTRNNDSLKIYSLDKK